MTTTKIEWTNVVWNPVTGCSKVSPGCDHCYAETEWKRLSRNPKTNYFERKFTDVQCHPKRLEDPQRWLRPRRVFVNSMSDLFHPDVSEEFILAVFIAMARSQRHMFQVLTKRPERMAQILRGWERCGMTDISEHRLPLKNVWLGVSVENREWLSRLDFLRQIPAAIRFVSFEPLLEDLGRIDLTGIDWVIVGGESGAYGRQMQPAWAQNIRDQCQTNNPPTPFFFKQWGRFGENGFLAPRSNNRTLDGVEWNEFPRSQQ